jgi:hypothetical protein
MRSAFYNLPYFGFSFSNVDRKAVAVIADGYLKKGQSLLLDQKVSCPMCHM